MASATATPNAAPAPDPTRDPNDAYDQTLINAHGFVRTMNPQDVAPAPSQNGADNQQNAVPIWPVQRQADGSFRPMPGTVDQDDHQNAERHHRALGIRVRHLAGAAITYAGVALAHGHRAGVQRANELIDDGAAARAEADSKTGRLRRLASAIGSLATRTRRELGPRWDYIMHGPTAENGMTGPWGIPAATELQPTDQRPAPRRRFRRDTRSGEPNSADRVPAPNPSLAHAATRIAEFEYDQLPQAQREAQDRRQWIANRAAVIPQTQHGRIRAARMRQFLEGNPQHADQAWEELFREHRLLTHGLDDALDPEDWVAARERVRTGSDLQTRRDVAIAGDYRVNAIQAMADRERADYAERQRIARERRMDVDARAERIGSTIREQLRHEVDFGKMQGNAIERARRIARANIADAIKSRRKQGLKDPFDRIPEDEVYAARHRAEDAVTFAVIKAGIGKGHENLDDEMRSRNAEALLQAIHQEVLDQLDLALAEREHNN